MEKKIGGKKIFVNLITSPPPNCPPPPILPPETPTDVQIYRQIKLLLIHFRFLVRRGVSTRRFHLVI
jgi:hypothetical protein